MHNEDAFISDNSFIASQILLFLMNEIEEVS